MKKKKKSSSFGEKEFISSLWKTMKEQEKKDPAVQLLHLNLEGSIKLIGLTGGIASGKSSISDYLKKHHKIPVIDADQIAFDVVRPKKKAYQEVLTSFGEGVLLPDKTLNREKIAQIVFRDLSKKNLLESIIHPEVFREITKQVMALKKKKARLIIIDAALLFESDLARLMHKTILIRVNPEVQLKRLMARDHLNEMDAWQRILAQMPTPEKEQRADFVIDNSEPLQTTYRLVDGILHQLKS